MAGSLEVICGPMFCGKTEELIRRLRRASIKKQVMAFKPEMDDRYSRTAMVSHSKIEFPTKTLQYSYDILMHTRPIADNLVVGIDEVQFFDEGILDVVNNLTDNYGHTVVVSGLDMDFRRVPFGITATLLGKADSILKLSAICMSCGGNASNSFRKNNDIKGRIAVGGHDLYEARCTSCYLEGMSHAE